MNLDKCKKEIQLVKRMNTIFGVVVTVEMSKGHFSRRKQKAVRYFRREKDILSKNDHELWYLRGKYTNSIDVDIWCTLSPPVSSVKQQLMNELLL